MIHTYKTSLTDNNLSNDGNVSFLFSKHHFDAFFDSFSMNWVKRCIFYIKVL